MSRFRGPVVQRRAMPSGNTLRPVEWIRHCTGPTPIADLPYAHVIVSPSEFDDFTRPTVVRIHGNVQLYVGDITFSTVFVVTYGITIVNPSEPPPDPLAEARGNRWLWWGCTHLVNQGGTADLEDNTSSFQLPLDIKSMRKRMVDGSELQLVFKADLIGVVAHSSTSVLIKE